MVLKVLAIAPFYKFFVKDLTEVIARDVDNITVFVHHNYLSEVAPYLPFPYFRHVEKFSKRNLVDLKNKPENVDIDIISTLYFIPDGRNWSLGDKIFKNFSEINNQNKKQKTSIRKIGR